MKTARIVNALTIDVEDGISIAMRDRFGKDIAQTDRVVRSTKRILELLARQDTKATFFILGQVGVAFPELVRDIQTSGHEIGVHGYSHTVFHKLDRKSAHEELYRGKAVLENLTGVRMLGHRAPCFSIDLTTAWVLDVLVELGFDYDSSIMPCKGMGYGWPGQRLDIGLIATPGGNQILEAPLTVTSILGRKVPALGGSYFRLLPHGLSRGLFKSIQSVRPVIMYVHPYELDAERYPDFYMDELAQASWKTQLRMRSFWIRRKSLCDRFERLIAEFSFCPLATFLANAEASRASP